MENNTIAGLDIERLKPIAQDRFGDISHKSLEKIALMIRVAHCARISYLNYEGTDDYLKDVKLHDRLASMSHFSPFEHCAQAMSLSQYEENCFSGNFKGFVQYRKTLLGENKKDSRVNKR